MKNKKYDKHLLSRRTFFKVTGTTTATVALSGCGKNPLDSNSAPLDNVPIGKMAYRENHNTGDKVSLLGFGCMRLPMKVKTKTEEVIDQDAYNELVDDAIKYGVNYFDTSPVYSQGLSERATGIALKRHPRNKYFVATKMSNHRPPGAEEAAISKALYYNSFKELQVDYFDYYLLHAVGLHGAEDLKKRYLDNGMLAFLLREREAGRIRNLGWSFHGAVSVFDQMFTLGVKWDFAQIQLNYMDWKHATGWNVNAMYLYGKLVEHNIPVVVMEPLLGGRLAQLNHESAALLKAQRPVDSIASWAFRYAATPPHVLTVLSGMTYKEHLLDNLRTYSPLTPLSEEETALLEKVTEQNLEYPLVSCTDCKYCMPCPYGIDIPGIFVHYNRCVKEGNFAKSRQDENFREARRAFLVGYDRNVPKLRQANHCIGCDKCVPNCPQRIKIPQEMARIDTYVEHLKQGTEFENLLSKTRAG